MSLANRYIYSNKLLIVAISIGFTWHRLPIDIVQLSCETGTHLCHAGSLSGHGDRCDSYQPPVSHTCFCQVTKDRVCHNLLLSEDLGTKKAQKPTIWHFRLVNNLERVNPPPLGYRRQAFCISKLLKQDDLVDKQQQSANIFSMSQWIGLRENLQETHGFLASNLKGFPVNFPIIQFYECLPQTEPSLILQYLQVLR